MLFSKYLIILKVLNQPYSFLQFVTQEFCVGEKLQRRIPFMQCFEKNETISEPMRCSYNMTAKTFANCTGVSNRALITYKLVIGKHRYENINGTYVYKDHENDVTICPRDTMDYNICVLLTIAVILLILNILAIIFLNKIINPEAQLKFHSFFSAWPKNHQPWKKSVKELLKHPGLEDFISLNKDTKSETGLDLFEFSIENDYFRLFEVI